MNKSCSIDDIEYSCPQNTCYDEAYLVQYEIFVHLFELVFGSLITGISLIMILILILWLNNVSIRVKIDSYKNKRFNISH
jgi:hypothetical protein